MRYVSTRGQAPILGFSDVLLAGLARDGGLYVPETVPTFAPDDFRALRGLSYAEVATRVMLPFLGGEIAEDDFAAMVADAYAGFDHRAVTPLRQLDSDLWLLELFHGPTLAFKDVALQLLGRLFDHVLTRRGERVAIVGATSGDTGAAAIEACRDRAAIDIVILHPKGRVSEVQRRQMTTVEAPNVHNLALEGTFDDCQDLVKAMFNDAAFRDEMRLSAVNSINWARIMAQAAYYVYAAVQIGAPERAVGFAVPTGNFGNVYAGCLARQMGLPVAGFAIGTNENDILARFFDADDMSVRPVRPTLSPSMDIQVSSNFERLLFDLYDRDGRATAEAMQAFRTTGKLGVGDNRWRAAADLIRATGLDDAATLAVIAAEHAATGELLDPHSAIGVAAARVHRIAGAPMVALATAHPAKFPDAVERAAGVRPALPPRLADLLDRPERATVLPNDLSAVQAFVRGAARR
ncbi:MAG: threonine synthase [Alphaproteobacteria bacterium]